jgi:DNA-binding Lrp family transcriptional regulator
MSSMQKIKRPETADNTLLDDNDRKIIQATQAGLPLVSRPYDAIAQQTGMDTEEVMRRMRNMQSLGIIRRIAAVPNHYSLGFKANGMTVWDVRDDVIDELGPAVGALEFVSHCYQRPRSLPDWPYNLFAMVHAHTREEARSLVAIIEDLLGDANRACDVLYSTRILKKTGMRLLS